MFDMYEGGKYNSEGRIRTKFGKFMQEVYYFFLCIGLLSPFILIICGFIYKIIVTF